MDRLVARYGTARVFMDVDSIVPGTDFLQRIDEELDSSAAMLVLIGPDWLGEDKGRHRLDDPDDFVRREVGAALEHKIPTIPVLVEGAPLPTLEELPEPLRPLLRRQAVNLASASWNYDISRVIKAVSQQIDPGSSQRFRPRWRVALAAIAGLIAILIVVVIVLNSASPHPGPKRTVSAVSAAAAVSAVTAPDRLTGSLLDTPFAGEDVPSGTSAYASQLSDNITSLTATGLMATINTRFAGPAAGIDAYYYVFDSLPDASSYYYSHQPNPAAFTPTGQHFAAGGVGDLTNCETSLDAVLSEWAWGCQTLSGNMVSSSVVLESKGGNGASLEKELALDTIRHLRSSANATPTRSAPLPPPGSSSLDANALFEQLGSTFAAALVPAGLGSPPTLSQYSNTANLPGLVRNEVIRLTFTGSGSDYTSTHMWFFVFDTAQDAQSWFNNDLHPVDNGQAEIPTGVSFSPSGFSPSQHAQCNNYKQPSGDVAQGTSACFVEWGDVVVAVQTDESATLANPKPQAADLNLALTLARSALLRVGQAVAP